MINHSNSSQPKVCHAQNFIYLSYQKILGRAPERVNINYYLERLRIGDTKIQILSQLYSCREGKTHSANISELKTSIRNYKIGRYPVIGRIFMLICGAKVNGQLERQLKIIENNIFPNVKENQVNSIATAEPNAVFRQIILQRRKNSAIVVEARSTENFNDPLIKSAFKTEKNKANEVHSHKNRIYYQLKSAVAAYGGREN